MVVILALKIFLLRNKDVRKIFGKKEIEIIIKQLEGINLTQSEKNRLSRDIRPKLDFIKECSLFKDEFKLKKGQDIKNIIDESVEIILEDELSNQIKELLLAGSFLSRTFNKRSDIDIFTMFKKDISVKEATQFRKRLLGKLNSRVDLQVFNVLPDKIKQSIIKNNKVIFKK